MCGICGIYNRGTEPVSGEKVVMMRDVMIDRGPDDAGLFIGEHIGLGHRRLTIVDTTSKGQQPMSNEDRKIWMVCNGEVYNYQDLKAELIQIGHLFNSSTDVEVFIHGYEEWGIEKILNKVRGAFALALWDANKEELLLSRDHVGKRPLLFYENNGKIYFASDIKSIVKAVEYPFELDSHAIDCFLGHICMPQTHSIFKGIKKVQPATYTVFNRNGSKTDRYWFLSYAVKGKLSEQEYLDLLEEKIISAVQKRIAENVPPCVLLSGGVDSSIVTTYLSQLSNNKVKTFSVGLAERDYNELPYARMVSEICGTEHHELYMKAEDIIEVLPKLIWHYGEPFADSSAIPSHCVSMMVKKHSSVTFTGDGGDELFAGYDWILRTRQIALYRKNIPPLILNYLLFPWAYFMWKISGEREFFTNMANNAKCTRLHPKEYSHNWMGWLGRGEQLYSQDFKKELNGHRSKHVYEDLFDLADGQTDVDRALFVDINSTLVNDYLVKMDIAAMSNSLESRSPFLDRDLMEFAARIPSDIKLKKGIPKYLLKRLLSKKFAKDFVHRKKWGFGIPIVYWLKGNLKPYIYEVILGEKARKRGYFNYSYVKNFLDGYMCGKTNGDQHRIWTLFILELWHRMFVDKTLTKDSTLNDLI